MIKDYIIDTLSNYYNCAVNVNYMREVGVNNVLKELESKGLKCMYRESTDLYYDERLKLKEHTIGILERLVS